VPAIATSFSVRLIEESDKDEVVRLLSEGFPRRSVEYWTGAWGRLAQLSPPLGSPKYGHVIVAQGIIVGVILVLTLKVTNEGGSKTRANLSSWYVKPSHRSVATLLLSRACKNKDVTYLNVSAATHTYAICEALGFKRYSEGQIAAFLLLSKPAKGLVIREYSGWDSGLTELENQTMQDHRGYGCICLVGTDGKESQPFIFVSRRIKGWLPAVQLIYCRSPKTFASYAKRIGLYFAFRATFFCLLDACGSMRGIKGRYYNGRSPKYYKGPVLPQLVKLMKLNKLS
jgi:hypothetical protein